MDIYKYSTTAKEWKDICNSSLSGKKRDEAFDNYIKTQGTKVTLAEYFQDGERNSFSFYHDKGYSYKVFGEAENCFERLAKEEIDWDDGLSYCSAKSHHSEDLIESRTDWDEMQSYADGLYYFVESLKNEIAEGKIVLSK